MFPSLAISQAAEPFPVVLILQALKSALICAANGSDVVHLSGHQASTTVI
jgi:hypothetical protein